MGDQRPAEHRDDEAGPGVVGPGPSPSGIETDSKSPTGNGHVGDVESAPSMDPFVNHVGIDVQGSGPPESPRRAEEERLTLALEAAEMGLWDWDIRTGAVHWNARHEAILGYPPGRPNRHYREFADRVHPDDLEAVEAQLRGAMQERRHYRFEHRIVWPDGTIRWVEAFGRFYYDDEGRPARSVGVVRDVTDRKAAAREIAALNRGLQERVTEFRTLLDVLPIGIAVAEDTECRRIWSNPALARMLGRPAGSNVSLSAPGEERPQFRVFEDGRELGPHELPMQVAIRTGREVKGVKNEFILPDGRRVNLLNHAVPLRDESGRIRGGLYVGVDITEQERHEKALREAERRLRAVFNQQFQFMVVLTPDGVVQEANETCFRATGVAPEDTIGRPLWETPWWQDLPETKERWRSYIARALRVDGPVTGAVEYRLADGSLRHGTTSVTALRDESGQPYALIAEGKDDTDRLAAESALRESERRWRTMAETLPNLVWTDLPDGQCDWLSTQWGEYTGIPERELLGLRWLDTVIHPDDRDRVRACWDAACADRAVYDLEYRIRRYDGEYRWFKTRGVPIRDDLGRIVYWFGTCTDIEDFKRAEAALKEADRRKDEFLATLAHELRNPLAPIRNAVQILRMTGLDADDVDRTLGMMERQVRHLVRLVDDLLDVSRVMRGKVTLHREPVELATVIAHAVETAQPLIESLSHELIVDLPDAPIRLVADPVRLAQVVANLLTNAAKYTERGGRIHLSAARDDRHAEIRVRDTGIGIPPEILPRVFDLFVQADHSDTRAQGGLGIGLTLVKNLVEMHGGTIAARSDGPGRGSEFVVRLPLPSNPTDAAEDRRDACE